MSDIQLFTLMLGVIAVVLAGVIAYVARVGNKQLESLGQVLGPVIETLIHQTDRALVPLGPQLEPLNSLLKLIRPEIDHPSDKLIAKLAAGLGVSPEGLAAAIVTVVDLAQKLTDGIPLEPEQGAPGETVQ